MIGAVIFAQNNPTVDYIKFAVFSANRVKEYLNIPVSIITDDVKYLLDNFKDHPFDKVIEIPFSKEEQQKFYYDGTLSKKKALWKNGSRNSVYNLTPYNRTIVLDSDYILNSDRLKNAINNDYDFQIYSKNVDLAEHRTNENFNRISPYSIPFYWATVFVFNKNPIVEDFFNLVEYIRSNWIYFRTLYNLDTQFFRNDHAFSIAIHIMNGKLAGDFAVELPGKMVFTSDKDLLVDAKNNSMRFLVEKKNHLGEYILVKTTGLDVHVLNKFSLNRFIDGGCGV